MKNKYNKELLERCFEKFQLMKENSDYQFGYWIVAELDKSTKNYKGQDKEIRDRLFRNHFGWWTKLTEKWSIRMPLNPELRLKKEDLFKTVRPRSALAKFIYAFYIDSDPALIKTNEYKVTISKKRLEIDKQIRKVLCWSLYDASKKKVSLRLLGRIFKAHKDTIGRWIDELNNLSEPKKKIIFMEALRNYKFPDIDVYELHHSKIKDYGSIAYSVDEKGTHLKNPRKKPSYYDQFDNPIYQ